MVLTARAKKAIRIMLRWQNVAKYKFTIDEFANELWRGEKRNASWRNNTAELLRRLSAHMDENKNLHCSLTRTSGIGRGAIAEYTTTGDYERLLK